jgi:hypothetical protein
MAIYRSRETREARQFVSNNDGDENLNALAIWANQGRDKPRAWHNGTNLFLLQAKGEVRLQVGDFVIYDAESDEFSSCKEDVFNELYALVAEE